ncbi:MAG: undecaprenyl-diphosphate phosphatase [Christensenellales bacterium]
MEIWEAILLGLVQGFTEFLPVSSSGHLVLVQQIIGISSGDVVLFDTLLHLATLVAVCIALRKKLTLAAKRPVRPLFLLITASLPAAIVGLALDDKIESMFSSTKYLWIFFAVSAVLLILSDMIPNKICDGTTDSPFGGIGTKQALAMGVMQAVAVFPGISRSGSTIVGGIVAGGDRAQVTDFSFLMSIPIILASVLLQIIKIATGKLSLTLPIVPTLLGMAAALVSGYLSVKVMLKVVAKCKLRYFGFYLIILSALTMLNNFVEIW